MPVVTEEELSKRRKDILDGARRCFAEHGFAGATVRRLEDATGKSRGAIFHHFQDKENLFFALARQDAARQAEVVAHNGLVEVMRDMLAHPERYDWLSTRLEITRLLHTDAAFAARWKKEQRVLDEAVRARLGQNRREGRLRTDVPDEVLGTFLMTLMDGFIARLVSGESASTLESVLQLAEETVRTRG